MSPTIDVVIPTYNSMPWLPLAVESVLKQTYKNIKVYVVDDGSTDGTAKYIKTIKDKRLHYIKKANGGVSSARNAGIAEASSDFIAFLDADDVWYPEKLQKQFELIKKDNGVGLVYGHHYIIDEEGVILRNHRTWKRGYIADDLAGGNLIAGSASMVLLRRSVLDQVGLFHEELVNGEDWELWLRIALVSKVDFVPEILMAVRQHDKNAQFNAKKMADGLLSTYKQIKKTVPLSPLQRRRVAAYCLYHAADLNLRAGERWQAKKMLLYFFTQNPRDFFQTENWEIHVNSALFPRVIFGNPLFDFLKRVVRKLVKLFLRFIKLCLKPFKFVISKLYRAIR